LSRGDILSILFSSFVSSLFLFFIINTILDWIVIGNLISVLVELKTHSMNFDLIKVFVSYLSFNFFMNLENLSFVEIGLIFLAKTNEIQ